LVALKAATRPTKEEARRADIVLVCRNGERATRGDDDPIARADRDAIALAREPTEDDSSSHLSPTGGVAPTRGGGDLDCCHGIVLFCVQYVILEGS
jgi:hypothetical protein